MVDRLERELKGTAQVIRLEYASPAGREAARTFGVELVPAILVFDGTGTLRYQAYGLQADWRRVRREAGAPSP